MRNNNNEILDKRFINIFNKFNNIDNAIYQMKIINKNNNENNNSKNKINKNVFFKNKENNKNNNNNNSRNNKKILKKNKTEKIFNNFYSNNNNYNFEENNENESTRRETLHFTSKFNYDSLNNNNNNNNNNSILIENNNNNHNNFYHFDNKKITFGSKICDCYQKYSNNFSFNPKISKNSLKINKNLELNGNNFISRILAKKHKNYNNK